VYMQRKDRLPVMILNTPKDFYFGCNELAPFELHCVVWTCAVCSDGEESQRDKDFACACLSNVV